MNDTTLQLRAAITWLDAALVEAWDALSARLEDMMQAKAILPVRPRTAQGWHRRRPGLARVGGERALKPLTAAQWRVLWRLDDRPLLYDLYAGQGGAGYGYGLAGFQVVGVDRSPQPNYPCDVFIQMDAIEFLHRYLRGEFPEAAAFHASPPCQFGTQLNHIHKHKPEYHEKHINMIPQTRVLLKATGKPYVIENVPGARKHLINPIMLCGKSFGLKVYRHRYFECSFFFLVPPHWKHQDKTPRAGGGCSPKGFVTVAGHGGVKYLPPEFAGGFREYAGMAMGIDWMSRAGLSQAIPPAFTEFIGKHLMAVLQSGYRSEAIA